jgi:hypothetical protein
MRAFANRRMESTRGNLTDTQSWNGYTYAGNNPTSAADPTGLTQWQDEHGSSEYLGECTNCGVQKKGGEAEDVLAEGETEATAFLTEATAPETLEGEIDAERSAATRLHDEVKSGEEIPKPDAPGKTGGGKTGAGKTGGSKTGGGRTTGAGKTDTSGGKDGRGSSKTGAGQTGRESHSDGGGHDPGAGNDAGDASGHCNSFDGTTKVLMADGTTKPIKDIRVSDQVQATDPYTGTTAARPVTLLHLNQDTELTDLTITTPDGTTATLHTTQHHRFWDQTTHQWTPAGELKPDDTLLTPAGPTATVVTVVNFASSEPMYNLTVNTDHTYYVMAGETPVLVHNDGGYPVWVLSPNGELLPGIPSGAVGTVTNNGKGLTYQLPAGTDGIDSRVTQMRVMMPTAQQPSGYVVYMNKSGQTVNPLTGRTTVGKSDPYAHLSLGPSCG